MMALCILSAAVQTATTSLAGHGPVSARSTMTIPRSLRTVIQHWPVCTTRTAASTRCSACYHYLFGVDFNPDYQRGAVWDDEDRQKLLDSLFNGRDIGRFVFKELPYTRIEKDRCYYEIVDGKQRMLTLLAYFENRFPYKGVYYNDLSSKDKDWLMNASIGVAEINQNATRSEVLEVFLALNEGGKPVAKEILDHARELLKGESSNGEM